MRKRDSEFEVEGMTGTDQFPAATPAPVEDSKPNYKLWAGVAVAVVVLLIILI